MKTPIPIRIYQLLLILWVLLILVGIFLTIPLAKGFADCYEQGSERYRKDTARSLKEGWDNQRVCLERREILDSISFCFMKVEKKDVPVSQVIEIAKLISPRTKQLEDFVNSHNTLCSDYPKSLVILN